MEAEHATSAWQSRLVKTTKKNVVGEAAERPRRPTDERERSGPHPLFPLSGIPAEPRTLVDKRPDANDGHRRKSPTEEGTKVVRWECATDQERPQRPTGTITQPSRPCCGKGRPERGRESSPRDEERHREMCPETELQQTSSHTRRQ